MLFQQQTAATPVETTFSWKTVEQKIICIFFPVVTSAPAGVCSAGSWSVPEHTRRAAHMAFSDR